MLVVDKEDIIECKAWMGLADYNYEEVGLPDESCILYCNIEHIRECFERIAKVPHKYIIISGYSDFGPCVQAEYPAWKDLIKWIHMQPINEAGYRGIEVQARVNHDKCVESDRYSNKCWSFTHSTIPSVPHNVVRWYCANNQIYDDNRVFTIPLGIGEGATGALAASPRVNDMNLLYVNFENYNIDRVTMKEHFQSMNYDWTTLHMECNRTQQQFYEDLASHTFILCPYGNGIDTYRFLETVYLGKIPVVWNSYWCRTFTDIPMVVVNHHNQITEETLMRAYEQFADVESELSSVRLSFWKWHIEESRGLLV